MELADLERQDGGKSYVMEVVDGKFVSLTSRNEKLGLTMSIVPYLTSTGTRSDKEIEVLFYRDNGKQLVGEVEIISTGDLLGMNDDEAPQLDPDLIEETVGQKYVQQFRLIERFSDFDDLIKKTFSDVVERRKSGGMTYYQ